MAEAVITPSPTPAAPAVLSLREHIDVETGVPPTPAPSPEPAKVVDPPPPSPEELAQQAEAEANSHKPDKELSEAGRALRRNRADERKAKIQREIDELVRQREETRADLQRLQRDRETPAPPQARIDPSDPRPVFDVTKYQADFPEDPYAGYLLDLNRWDRRQEQKQTQSAARQQQSQAQLEQAVQAFQGRAKTWRESHSDFDAVVSALPMTPVIEQVIRLEEGPAVAYHLATHPAVLRELSSLDPPTALIRLGRLVHELTSPPPVTPPITKAPPPMQTAEAGVSGSAADDPNKRSTRDHFKAREAEDAERRKRGLR